MRMYCSIRGVIVVVGEDVVSSTSLLILDSF